MLDLRCRDPQPGGGLLLGLNLHHGGSQPAQTQRPRHGVQFRAWFLKAMPDIAADLAGTDAPIAATRIGNSVGAGASDGAGLGVI